MAVSERCLSDFWRQDKSDDRVMELTSVLRGADGVIGVMGSGVRATWSTNGQSETWWVRMSKGGKVESQVFLDYSPIARIRPPFGGLAVDEIIGYAAHEGGHCLWSDPAGTDHMKNLISKHTDYKIRQLATDAAKVQAALRIDNIIEDAYIDYHVGKEWPVLGEYIRHARHEIQSKRSIDHDAIARQASPSRRAIMNLWIACSLYDLPLPDKMTAKVRRAIIFLTSKSVEAVSEKDSEKRMKISVDAWAYLEKEFPVESEQLPRKAPPQQGGGQGAGGGEGEEGDEGEDDGGAGADRPEGEDEGQKLNQLGGGGDEGDEGDEGKSEGDEGEGGDQQDGGAGKGGKPGDQNQPPEAGKGGDGQGEVGDLDEFDLRDLKEVPERLLEQVLDAISHEIEDLSKSVAQAMNIKSGVNANTKKGDYDGPAADRVRDAVQPQIAEMRRVFDRQASVKSRHVKGLTSGKLDPRALARVGCGNLRVYKRRDVIDKPDLAVGLLLDVSGSMSSNMSTVWATAAVFGEALIRKPGVNFLALTYTGGYTNCQTTRIIDKEMGKLCIGNVDQGGGTPTGVAIASLKVLMDRMREREKVLIHFTDGSPDDAQQVMQAVADARKAGYTVWAIAPDGCERMLQQQYGDGNYETISSIRDLPNKVRELVMKLVA